MVDIGERAASQASAHYSGAIHTQNRMIPNFAFTTPAISGEQQSLIEPSEGFVYSLYTLRRSDQLGGTDHA